MTVAWRHYRYLAANKSLLGPLARMEADVSRRPLYQIPKNRVAKIESKLQSGDIIGIVGHDGRLYSTSHVGLALRTSDGVLHFLHASAPNNYGKVVVDSRLRPTSPNIEAIRGSWSRGRCGKICSRFAMRSVLQNPVASPRGRRLQFAHEGVDLVVVDLSRRVRSGPISGEMKIRVGHFRTSLTRKASLRTRSPAKAKAGSSSAWGRTRK